MASLSGFATISRYAIERYHDALALASAFRAALAPVARRPEPVGIEICNPFKGLRPFLESDAPDFFGREAILAEILARLSDRAEVSRFLAVVGLSGSGKSSLVRAGLLPALRRGALPGSERWFIADMRPGRSPIRGVGVGPDPDRGEPTGRPDRQAGTGRGRAGDDDELALPPGTELVLVIDQFEELFTLLDDDDARRRFLAAMSRAASDPGSRLRVLVTLRADFCDRPLTYPGLAELMKARSVVVTPLVPEEIVEPRWDYAGQRPYPGVARGSGPALAPRRTRGRHRGVYSPPE